MNGSPLGRVVEIAEPGRTLSKYHGFLVISHEGDELARLPFDDLSAVIITTPQAMISSAVFAAMADRGIAFLSCNHHYQPVASMWPVSGHHAQQGSVPSLVEKRSGATLLRNDG